MRQWLLTRLEIVKWDMRTSPLEIFFALLPPKFEFVLIFLFWILKLIKTEKLSQAENDKQQKKVSEIIFWGKNKSYFFLAF